jgi:cobalt-zinc-cadmium efflux system membrane fusion protein
MNKITMIWIGVFYMVFMSAPFGRAGERDDHGHKHEESKDHKSHTPAAESGDEHGHDHGDEHGHEDGPIELSKESQELGGIRTAKAGSASVTSRISVSGRIAQDVEEVYYVTAPESAVIQECRAVLGNPVNKDETVCTLILNSTKETVEIKSPVSGTVISEFVKKGEHVDETTAMYAIADMSKLPANFDVYEKDIASIRLGQTVIVYPLSYTDKAFKGKIVFISPRVDESTYTVKIRVLVNNPKEQLKLGMSLRGEILSESGAGITVPAAAIQTLAQKTVVFVRTDQGFLPKEVKTGVQTKESVAIEEGIAEGDEIVVEGAFILKSKMMESEMGHDHAH